MYTWNQRNPVWLFVSLMADVVPENQLHETWPDVVRLVLLCLECDTSWAILAASVEQLNRKYIWFWHWLNGIYHTYMKVDKIFPCLNICEERKVSFPCQYLNPRPFSIATGMLSWRHGVVLGRRWDVSSSLLQDLRFSYWC